MREILFRGQTRKRGQKVNMAGENLPGIWVYGCEYTAPVEFRDGLFRVRCRFPETIDRITFAYKPEIIGNIHDNPELLEVQENV